MKPSQEKQNQPFNPFDSTFVSMESPARPTGSTRLLAANTRQQPLRPIQEPYSKQSMNIPSDQMQRESKQSFNQPQMQGPSYKPTRVIGNGAFGYVFEAFDNNRQCKVALKRTQKAGNIISREYEVLDMLRGKENVVQMLDFFYSIDDKQRIIQNTVLEFCDMSLEDLLKELDSKKDYCPMMTAKKYAKEIFQGLANMHDLGIAHRDLKPENILLKDNSIRICDVGSSKILDRSESRMNTPYVVSRYYRAPELILACNKYDFSIDIWAVGCILFELLLKTPMFPGDAEGVQVVEMQQILGPPTDDEMGYLQRNLIEGNVFELFKRCCQLEKNQKLDLFTMLKTSPAYLKHQIYNEQDLKDAADIIEKCLKWVNKDRITAEEALQHPFCQY